MPSGVSKKIIKSLRGLGKGTGDVVSNTVRVTRDITAGALSGGKAKGSKTSRNVAEETVEAAIDGGAETGADLGSVAKGAIIGAIEGVDKVTSVDESVISGIARAAVKRASKVGGDVVGVAKKAVEGAIEAAERAGMKVDDATTAAITGAIEGAETVSEDTATAITKALSKTFKDVRATIGLKKKPIILAIDSNRANCELISQQLIKEGYETLSATSMEELDQIIREKKKIALGLIDLSGFDQDIWGHCEALRKAKIPFIVISPQRSPLVQKESMKCGASGLLLKPVSMKELMEYVHTSLGE